MKKVVFTLLIVICIVVLASCGHRMGNRITGGRDVQTFTDCIIYLGDTEILRGAVTQWRDYDNSDEVQVLVNGKYYLTHYSNIVMIADPERGALNYGDASFQGIDE